MPDEISADLNQHSNRKKYVALHNSQPPTSLDGLQNASGNYNNVVKEEFAFSNGFNVLSICKVPDQMGTFNSSSSTFDAPQMGDMDEVSSVVSMLKGTLERKKLNVNTGFDQVHCTQLQDMVTTLQEVSTIDVEDDESMQKVEGSPGS